VFSIESDSTASHGKSSFNLGSRVGSAINNILIRDDDIKKNYLKNITRTKAPFTLRSICTVPLFGSWNLNR
jgi:hypothetical protein